MCHWSLSLISGCFWCPIYRPACNSLFCHSSLRFFSDRGLYWSSGSILRNDWRIKWMNNISTLFSWSTHFLSSMVMLMKLAISPSIKDFWTCTPTAVSYDRLVFMWPRSNYFFGSSFVWEACCVWGPVFDHVIVNCKYPLPIWFFRYTIMVPMPFQMEDLVKVGTCCLWWKLILRQIWTVCVPCGIPYPGLSSQ